MPQFDAATFGTQLFWLLVSFSVLFVAMWRYALPRLSNVLEARKNRIDSDLEKAAALKREAVGVLADYERALAEARDKATAEIKQESNELAAESAKRHEAFQQELQGKTREAEQRIASAKNDALANIKTVAAEVASAAAVKLIGVEPPAQQVQEAVEDAIRRRG